MIKMELVIKNRRKCKVSLADDWSEICDETDNQAIKVEKYIEKWIKDNVEYCREYIIITCVPLRPSDICDTIEFVFDAKTKEPLNATYIDFTGTPEYDFKFTVNK